MTLLCSQLIFKGKSIVKEIWSYKIKLYTNTWQLLLRSRVEYFLHYLFESNVFWVWEKRFVDDYYIKLAYFPRRHVMKWYASIAATIQTLFLSYNRMVKNMISIVQIKLILIIHSSIEKHKLFQWHHMTFIENSWFLKYFKTKY